MKFLDVLEKIESLLKELAALQPLSPEREEKLQKKFRLEFNYNSNHIEGNTLTYGETMLCLIFDKTTGDHDLREYEEMKASDVALKLVQEYAADKERPLTESFIKELNKLILVRPYWSNAITADGQPTQKLIEPGDYKKSANSVKLQNGEMFYYASPQETPALMGDLLAWYNTESEKKELHPVALAALLHYRFVRIHPFDDGNGRISRLLMNYVLYRNNFPPVIIKSADKRDYLTALNKADSGDIDAFVMYVAAQMIWSLELSINASKGLDIEEKEDIDKEVALWKRDLISERTGNTVAHPYDTINKLYAKSFGNFLKSFENKFSSLFKDLFTGWRVRGLVNRIIEFPIGFLYTSSVHPAMNIESIMLNMDLSGFKRNSKNDISLNIKLELVFSADHYKIKVFTPSGIKTYGGAGKTYDQVISSEEQETIISDTAKAIFSYIKEHTEVQI